MTDIFDEPELPFPQALWIECVFADVFPDDYRDYIMSALSFRMKWEQENGFEI